MKRNVDIYVPDKRRYVPEHLNRTNYNSMALFVSTVHLYVTAVLAHNYEIFDTKSCIIPT